MTVNDPIVNLSDAFGKALLQQFFEPIMIGRDPQTGTPFYSASGVAILAQNLFTLHATKLMDEVWAKIDMEDLAQTIADMVVAELTKVPGQWDRRNVHQEELAKRVKEIAAQQLGQRVVDAMDLHFGPKEIEAPATVKGEVL